MTSMLKITSMHNKPSMTLEEVYFSHPSSLPISPIPSLPYSSLLSSLISPHSRFTSLSSPRPSLPLSSLISPPLHTPLLPRLLPGFPGQDGFPHGLEEAFRPRGLAGGQGGHRRSGGITRGRRNPEESGRFRRN